MLGGYILGVRGLGGLVHGAVLHVPLFSVCVRESSFPDWARPIPCCTVVLWCIVLDFCRGGSLVRGERVACLRGSMVRLDGCAGACSSGSFCCWVGSRICGVRPDATIGFSMTTNLGEHNLSPNEHISLARDERRHPKYIYIYIYIYL